MIQFNLLPDVKLEYLKTTRTKRTVMVIATIAASVALFAFIVLFISVRVLQKDHLANLDKDIKASVQEIKNISDINKVLTIQNQLNNLPALHDQKPAASRLFNYLAQLTPDQISITKFEIDFSDAQTISVEGEADSLGTVNKFVDTLKFTEYILAGSQDKPRAFSNVVLSSFALQDGGTSYEISLIFDPLIFDSKQNLTLNVPPIVTTRSELEKPNALFIESTQPPTEGPR